MKTFSWMKCSKVAVMCAGAMILGTAARAGTPAASEAKVARLEREVTDLRKKVADLEQQLRTLRLLVNQLAANKGGVADAREARQKASAEIDALCRKLSAMGEKGRDSEELRRLLAFGSHDDRSVRIYQVAALAKLPLSLSAGPLERLVREGDYDAAKEALGVLARRPKVDCRDVVAKRAANTFMSSKAPDGHPRQYFVLAACDYLTARNDPRGVRAYMAKLAEQNGEIAEMQRSRTYGMLMLMRPDVLDRYSGLSGYGKKFVTDKKWASVSDPALQKFVADFLAWWEKNKADFKEIRRGAPKPPPDEPRKPEQF